MATQFAMPVPATHGGNAYTSPNQYTLYGAQSQPISPIQSATATPNGGSPTSPQSHLSHITNQSRQLRPMKSPLYIPAVLRPTEAPKRVQKPSGPSTPPHSSNNSFDSANNNVRPLDQTPRRNTGDSGKFGLGKITEIENSISHTQGLGKVTDYPTRKHWKIDANASICDAPACHATFSLFTRRHHCRRCGNIFCDTHSSNSIPLDQDANYHPAGTYARSCDYCYTEYRGWEIARSSRSNSEDSTAQREVGIGGMEPPTPTIGCPKGKTALKGVFGKGGIAESLGQSVPRDWNWSTF